MVDATVRTMYIADDMVIAQSLDSRWQRAGILPRVTPNPCIPIFFASDYMTTYRSPVGKFRNICPRKYAKINSGLTEPLTG
jgi:hypothetical protein